MGLEVAGAEDGRVSLTLGAGAQLAVVQDETQNNPNAAGLFHIAYRYPTRIALSRAFRRLIDEGISIQGASDHDVSEALYLADPEGNGIELTWDRPRDEWKYEAGTFISVLWTSRRRSVSGQKWWASIWFCGTGRRRAFSLEAAITITSGSTGSPPGWTRRERRRVSGGPR